MLTTSRSSRSLRQSRPAPLMDALEPRCLLAFNNLTTFQDPDDNDQITVELTGPGKLNIDVPTRSITIVGSTSTSLLVVSVKQNANGRLNWNRIESSGSMGTINAPAVDINAGVNAQILVAGSVRSITFGDLFTADLTIQTPGTIATNIRGRFVDNSSMHLGRVGSLDVDNLIGGVVIQADRVNTFAVHNVTGGIGPIGTGAIFDLDLSGAVPYSVRTMRIEGDLIGGEWDLGGSVQSIDINRGVTSIAAPLLVTMDGRLGSLKGGRLIGHWTAQSFGVIAAADQLNARFTTTGGGIDSVRGNDVSVVLTLAANFGIKLIVAGSDLVGGIFADFVDSITVTGGGATITMDLLGATNRPLQLKTMTVAGVLRGHTTINGNVGSVSLGGTDLLFFNVGATPPGDPEGFITSASQVAAGKGNVQSLKIKAALGDPENFSRSVFNVRRFGSLITTARTNVFIPASLFGFRFVEAPGTVNVRLSISGSPDQFISSPATTSFSLVEFEYERVV